MKNKLVLSLGSNLGNRYAYLIQAIAAINKSFHTTSTAASFYETPPWGDTNQSTFINTALVLYTSHSPAKCLLLLQNIEHTIGRTKSRKWGPRCIDIDIIFYSNSLVQLNDLQLPHARMQERAFVLKPIVDILPDFIHPKLGKSMRTLLSEIADDTSLFAS